jgi:hypothetical protein
MEGILPNFVLLVTGVRDRTLALRQISREQGPGRGMETPDDQYRSYYRTEVVSGYEICPDGALSPDDGNRVCFHEIQSVGPSVSLPLAFPYPPERKKPRRRELVTRVR